MAKALYGHFATHDATLVWENDRLRARVAVLEAEVDRLTLALDEAAGSLLLGRALDDASEHLRPALA